MNPVAEQFAKRAGTYSGSARWISDSALIQAHVDACGPVTPGRLLEICCGTGMVGRSFRAAGWLVCGVDLTAEMAAEANRFFPCVCAPAEAIPFLDGAFDAAVIRQAYFLLDDGQKVLAQAARVLKPDGVFVLSQTVPYGRDDAAWLERIHRAKQAQLRQFHTEESLARELEREQFRIESVRRLTVRENITRWMEAAPELSAEKRAEVCGLVAGAPEPYRRIHGVDEVDGEIFENWNWVVFTAGKKDR